MALVKRNTAYSLDDIVNTKYGIKLKCTTAGTTDTDPLILNGASPITDGTVVWEVQEEQGTGQGLVDWEANKNYSVKDIVIYDDRIFRCITAHTSTSTFDVGKWREISACANITSSDKVNLSFEQNLNDTGSLGVNWTPVDASPIYEAGKSGFGLNCQNAIKSDVPWFNIIPRVDDFTVDFWFELENGFSSSGNQYPVFNTSDDYSVPNVFLLSFANSYVRVAYADGSGSLKSFMTILESSYVGNGFHHVLFTRHNTYAQLKIDNVLLYDIYDFPIALSLGTTTTSLQLGNYSAASQSGIVIDDFRIY